MISTPTAQSAHCPSPPLPSPPPTESSRPTWLNPTHLLVNFRPLSTYIATSSNHHPHHQNRTGETERSISRFIQKIVLEPIINSSLNPPLTHPPSLDSDPFDPFFPRIRPVSPSNQVLYRTPTLWDQEPFLSKTRSRSIPLADWRLSWNSLAFHDLKSFPSPPPRPKNYTNIHHSYSHRIHPESTDRYLSMVTSQIHWLSYIDTYTHHHPLVLTSQEPSRRDVHDQ